MDIPFRVATDKPTFSAMQGISLGMGNREASRLFFSALATTTLVPGPNVLITPLLEIFWGV